MDTDLARAFAHAAQQMHRAGTVDDTLQVIVRLAADSLPSFDHIGVSTLQKGGKITTRASTSDVVTELDEVQYSLREGPCVASLAGADVIVVPHVDRDERWPRYVPVALAHGLRSQLAVRLHLDGPGTVGGLNLYSTTTPDITDDDVATASIFASHASVALGQAQATASLDDAVSTRQLIGQAIGILMERYKVDEKAAHAFLWRASSHGNVKVRAIAATVVDEANAQADAPADPHGS